MNQDNLIQKCEDVIKNFRNEINKVRAGRANPSLFENIFVDVYETKMPISHIASITAPDANTVIITPWDKDKKILDSIVNSILKSDIGINPIVDENCIRLNVPPLTEERRKELVKLIDKFAETSRVGIRNIRRNALSDLNKMKIDEKLPDDYVNNQEKEIEAIIKKYLQIIEEVLSKKKKEILGFVN